MAKEKRWHCPECSAKGTVKPFVSQSAMEMHRRSVHHNAAPRYTAPAPPDTLQDLQEIYPPRRNGHVSGTGVWMFLAALLFVGLIGYLVLPTLQRGWVSFTDPTAVHD